MKATRLFAVMAVLAMVFAGAAVIAEQNDATSTHKVTCFAEGKLTVDAAVYNKMMVFGYDDSAVIIDTTYMNLNNATEFIVELENNASTPVKMTVGPVSATNGKIVIDAGAKSGLFANNLAVTLKNYEDTSAALSIAVLKTSTVAVEVELMPNHNANWSKANGYNYNSTEAEAKYVATAKNLRGEKFTLDETIDAKFVDSNDPSVYELKGWSISPAETAAIDFYPGDYTTEQIIMALAAAHMQDANPSAEPAVPGYSPVPDATVAASGDQLDQVEHTLLLFAIYEKNTYSLLLAYGLDANGVPEAGYGINDIAFPKANPSADPPVTSKVKASVTSKVDADSFGIIKIQQLVPGQYTYGFTVYKADGTTASGEKKYVEDTDGDNYDIKMITNGVFKIYHVASDLVISIETTAKEDPTAFDKTGYAFQIDAIANDDGNHGKVKLSLDLYDYTPMTGTNKQDKITIAGTYFKNLDDGVRAYGNLANCGQVVAGDNINLYLDNSATASNDSLVAGEIAATLVAPATGLEGNSVYDLVWNDANSSDPAIGIYAAQGVWDQYSEDTTEATATQVYTPWSLFTA